MKHPELIPEVEQDSLTGWLCTDLKEGIWIKHVMPGVVWIKNQNYMASFHPHHKDFDQVMMFLGLLDAKSFVERDYSAYEKVKSRMGEEEMLRILAETWFEFFYLIRMSVNRTCEICSGIGVRVGMETCRACNGMGVVRLNYD